jgi:hypothetical protein
MLLHYNNIIAIAVIIILFTEQTLQGLEPLASYMAKRSNEDGRNIAKL